MPKSLSRAKDLLVQTWKAWNAHNAPRIGAALAYYTAFSMAPVLLIAIAVAGMVFGQDAARDQMGHQLRDLLGETGAKAVQEMLVNAHKTGGGVVATVIGAVTLLLGASSLFGELQSALNLMWNAPDPGKVGILKLLRARLLSFSMVLVIGFLLLVSLVLSAVLSGLSGALGGAIAIPIVAQAINTGVSLGVTTLLFGLIFKVLPDVKVAWRDVAVGALVTALLFSLGKLGIGVYLGNSALASTYGAAGSFAVLLVWVFYSAQLILFGAEFTHVYAHRNEAKPPTSAEHPVAAGVSKSVTQNPSRRQEMENEMDVDHETLGQLVSSAADAFGAQAELQVELVKAQLSRGARAFGKKAGPVAVGIPFLGLGYVLGCVAAALGLAHWLGTAGGVAVVAGLNLLLGGIAVYLGISRMHAAARESSVELKERQS